MAYSCDCGYGGSDLLRWRCVSGIMLKIYDKGRGLSFSVNEELMLDLTAPRLSRWHRFKIWLRQVTGL